MEFNKLLFERRSVRSFTRRKLTEDELNYILTAGVNAPSACNLQSWHFICVTDPEVKAKLKDICADWISTAPVVIIVCTDSAKIEERCSDKERAYKFTVQDTALAMENMLLAAADIGFGGCIIGDYDQDKCVNAFNIPKKYLPVALLPIGEPTIKTPPRPRKPISEVVTFIGEAPKTTEYEQEKNEPFSLKCQWLPDAVFDDLGLPNTTFNNINLSCSRFTDINLSGSKFSDINFTNSSFGGLNLTGSSYCCVEMNEAHFKNTEFKNAHFENCDFSGATVDGVNLLEALSKCEQGDR